MSAPLQILIVEDEYITQKTITVFLKEMGYHVVGCAMQADEALRYLNQHKVDFVILDITIKGEKDGIWLAEKLHQHYAIPYIFLTAYVDEVTVKNAIATNPYGYLVKPFQKAALFSAIEIALINFNKCQQVKKETPASIVVKHQDIFEKVTLDHLYYIESQKNYLILTTSHKQYRIRATVTDFLEKLPDNFIKTHKGFIVNTDKIQSFSSNVVTINGQNIPVSKTYKDIVFNSLHHSSLKQ
ncbi:MULTISPECIES: response regulator [unclassified Flavobacterium]|uniref:LytR/AlgR family response regulator transcription factor n=1 Tax=unclassified Flavobacterium TaxID=196869 RepID=UPI002602935F|nr:response regulator [Flavobacterium sp.]